MTVATVNSYVEILQNIYPMGVINPIRFMNHVDKFLGFVDTFTMAQVPFIKDDINQGGEGLPKDGLTL